MTSSGSSIRLNGMFGVTLGPPLGVVRRVSLDAFVPTYPAEIRKSLKACRSIVKCHCCAYGVRSLLAGSVKASPPPLVLKRKERAD